MITSLLSRKADRMRENVVLQVMPDGSRSRSFMTCRKSYISTDTVTSDDMCKFTAKASFLHPGFNKCWIPNTTFCTCSSYEGEWNGIGMVGMGEFYFPHDANFCIKMIDIDVNVCKARSVISADWEREITNIEPVCKIKRSIRFKEPTVGDSHHSKFDDFKKPTQRFNTGSSYKGKWNLIGMNGGGLYSFMHDMPSSRPKAISYCWQAVLSKQPSVDAAHCNFIRGRLLKQILRPKFNSCCDSSYTGEWNSIGFGGFGNYDFVHGVEYEGNLRDGMFHGHGTMTYPMGQKVEGEWYKGRCITFKYKFADGLEYSEPWNYCIMPDRRFYTSIQDGLRPAGRSLLTNQDPPREIPEGCYDTGDGFYNPATKCVTSAIKPNKIIRIPTAAEEKWIMEHCRKAWDEPTRYRPDLYEHWVTGRTTDSIFDESSLEDEDEGNDKSSSSSESWEDSQTAVKIIVSSNSDAIPSTSITS